MFQSRTIAPPHVFESMSLGTSPYLMTEPIVSQILVTLSNATRVSSSSEGGAVRSCTFARALITSGDSRCLNNSHPVCALVALNIS